VKTGRRARSRLRVELAAKLSTTSDSVQCTLVDLSCSGAQVLVDGPIRAGVDVILNWREHEVFGNVAWSAFGRCGIVFEQPIAEQLVVQMRSWNALESEAAEAALVAREWVEGRSRLSASD
jgi:hypothetical protein